MPPILALIRIRVIVALSGSLTSKIRSVKNFNHFERSCTHRKNVVSGMEAVRIAVNVAQAGA